MFCGQKRSPSFADALRRQGRGAFFRVSGCLHCNSVAEGGQVISASYMAQRLRDCKQKKHSPYQILSFGISRST